MTAAAVRIDQPETYGASLPRRPGDLITSARVLVDALAALEQAREARDAAARRWTEAMRTVQLAQEATALDMPPGAEPITIRISATHVATIERAGRRAVKLTRSRVLAGRG